MEKSEETKGFYAYRTTLRALSDGVSLQTRNATMLLKASWPLLLLVSLLGAWTGYGVLKCAGAFLLAGLPSGAELTGTLIVPLVLFVAVLLIYFAWVYTVFGQYIEKGFIPLLTRRRYALCSPVTRLPRLLVGMLWVLFSVVIFVALAYALSAFSRWTLILSVPLGIVLLFWLMNQLTGYVLIADTLMGSIRHSLGVTLKGLGSFLTVAVVLTFVLGVIGCICLIPSLCSEIIYTKAQMSLAVGDDGDLPSYFMPVYFIARMLSTFLMLLLTGIGVSCWCMVYGAVETRLRLKKEEKEE